MSRTTLKLTDRKRADVMRAAVEIFNRDGFNHASMDNIAIEACVSKRTIYNHFASKELLFTAIIEQLKTDASRVSDFQFATDRSLSKQLQDFGMVVTDFLLQPANRKLARVVVSRFLEDPTIAGQVFGNTKLFEEALADWIAAGVRAKKLRCADQTIASRQFLAMLETFVFWPQLLRGAPAPSRASRVRLVDSAVAMFLDHYAAK